MVHGTSDEDCESAVGALAAATGLADRRLLWTTREFKKRRVKLFDEAEQAWEARHAE